MSSESMRSSKTLLCSSAVPGCERTRGRTLPRTAASATYSSPIVFPMTWRSLLERAGESPPVEMATLMGPRSTIEGTMNEQSSGLSTTLQKMRLCRASSLTARLVFSSSVAAMTRKAFSRSSSSYSRVSISRPSNEAISSVTPGAMTFTCAPAFRRVSILRAATVPPPTTTTGLPLRSMKIGM